MYRKTAFALAGLAFISAPVLVSAQTTSQSNAALIVSLTALVQQLEQEIQQLLAAQSTKPQTDLCAAYATLERGDTDATTGGQVSLLQAWLGISPATGYYGARTGIGYSNKCSNSGNAQPASVAGMSKYTDSDFGFSFWYPSTWTVSTASSGTNGCFGGTAVAGVITLTSGNQSTTLKEFISPSGITYACGKALDQWYFASGAWMYKSRWANYAYGVSGQPRLADISNNTMGGLHIFANNIVPLSADHFVVLDDTYGAINPSDALLQTIVATDPTVAIPVPTAQQIKTVQAEARAYGANTTSPTQLSAYQISGKTFTLSFSQGHLDLQDVGIDFGDNSAPSGVNGMCGAPLMSNNPGCGAVHTYPTSGTYIAKLIVGAQCGGESNQCINLANAQTISTAIVIVP